VESRERILEIVEGLLAGTEYEVIEVEIVGTSRGTTVRIFIDGAQGFSLEDCTRISRIVGDEFETRDLMAGRYILEVSSPGIDRPLRKPEDFRRFAGETVQITTFEKIGDRHRHGGTLTGFDQDRGVVLIVGEDGEPVELPLGTIKRANLKRDPWEGKRQPKPAGRPRKPKRRKGKR
jgi:ribosome maturation factor RimP